MIHTEYIPNLHTKKGILYNKIPTLYDLRPRQIFMVNNQIHVLCNIPIIIKIWIQNLFESIFVFQNFIFAKVFKYVLTESVRRSDLSYVPNADI